MFESVLAVLLVAMMVLSIRVLFEGSLTPSRLPAVDPQPDGWRGDDDWFWFESEER